MPLPSSAPVELLPDPDRAAVSLAAQSADPRLAEALATILALDGDEHPFDGFVSSAAARLEGWGAELGGAVAEVGRTAAGPGATPFVGRVVSAADRFSRLTTRLTEYARACDPPLTEEVDLSSATHASVATLAALGLPAPDDVTVAGPPLPLDPEQARLVLRHLLGNAAAYAPGPVTVTAQRDGARWELRVDDHGPGVPTADRLRVLQPLVRLDRDRAVPGDGLGLAVCARVARGHRGMIFVNRSASGGASLRLVGGLR